MATDFFQEFCMQLLNLIASVTRVLNFRLMLMIVKYKEGNHVGYVIYHVQCFYMS